MDEMMWTPKYLQEIFDNSDKKWEEEGEIPW